MALGFLKQILYTRKAMQHLPSGDLIHLITDDELAQLHQCFLKIISDIDAVCTKHGICYMAAGGTTLGAIRHGGFIPWDDDVDLIMPRSDLKKFLEIFDDELGDQYEITSPDSKYPLESMITAVYLKNTYKDYFLTYNAPFPKGIRIDIFPIETVPENPIKQRLKGTAAILLQYIAVSTLFYHYMNPVKKKFFCQSLPGRINFTMRMVTGFIFSFRSYEKWGATFDRFVQGPQKSNLWAVPTDIGHYFGHIMPKSVYYPPLRHKFENIEINIPHDPDQYLRNQYGDYMIIPEVEDRETHYSVGFSLNVAADEEAGIDIFRGAKK